MKVYEIISEDRVDEGLVGTAIWGGLAIWGIKELFAPVIRFYDVMSKIDKNSPNYQATLDKQTGILILDMGAMFVGGKLVGALFKSLGLLTRFPVFGNFIKKLGINEFRTWLNDKENADSIAAAILMHCDKVPIIGGLIKQAEHVISPFLEPIIDIGKQVSNVTSQDGDSENGTAPAGTTTDKPNNSAKKDIDSTSSPTPQQGKTGNNTTKPEIDPNTGMTSLGRKMWSTDPNAVKNYDITGWVQKPGQPGFIQDPKDPSRFLPKPYTYTWTPN